MRISLKVFLGFLTNCIWAIADSSPQYEPYVVREPLGPDTANGIELELMKNLKATEKEVRLNLGWEFESSTTINDIRSINEKTIVDYSSIRFNFETYNHDGWVLFGLSDNSKLEGNDFIIFKHGCGNDSEYTLQAPASSFGPPNPDAPKTEFTDESTEKMKEPCKNHTFYHVEVELIGDQNNTFKAEESNDSTEPRLSPFGPDFYPGVEPDIEHPEDDDENPKLLKIRKATLLEWDVTDDKEEKIWFDKPPTIVLKSNGGVNNQMMLKGFGAPERDDLKRKTTIMRKINPSDCNFQPLANQNIFLHWGIFVENFNDSVLNKLNDTDGEVIIRRSHLYNEISVHNEEGQAVYKRAGFGNRPIHLIDFHDVADTVIESSQTALASGANTNDTDKPENATWYRVNFYDNSEEDSNDQDDKS